MGHIVTHYSFHDEMVFMLCFILFVFFFCSVLFFVLFCFRGRLQGWVAVMGGERDEHNWVPDVKITKNP